MAEQKQDERYKKIIVIGAGLAGSLLALLLGKRGYDVHVYERREDTRINPASWEGRSINLALSKRGITAFEKAGVAEAILPSCIEMTGRLMHSVSGELSYMPYGLSGQSNLSAGRQRLNEELMSAAEKSENVHLYFNYACKHIDLENKIVRFEYKNENGDRIEKVEQADLIIGTDGAFSEVRGAMIRKRGTDYSQEYLSHAYKELTIPPNDGKFALDENRLHIWPRGEFMMIALPNPDKSFTVTLFLPLTNGFDKLTNDEEITTFFAKYFSDAVPIMPTYLADFKKNPTGHLMMVKVSPWHYKENAVIMGDAAHAIVPFYGQGMNASLEDVIFFDELIEKHAGNFQVILSEFSRLRKPNTDAIAELSLRNYIEMRAKVASKLFLWRTSFEKTLHRWFPSYFIPLYSMVSYTNIPYAEVIKRSERQTKILDRLFTFTSFAGVLSIGALAAFAFSKRNQLLN